MKVSIATGKSVTNSQISNGTLEWEKLAQRLTTFKVTKETYAEYMALPVDKQGRIKDVGYFICGSFNGSTRKRESLIARSVLTFDIDFIPADDLDDIKFVYQEYEYVLHSTHKHSADNPRLRLAFPLSRPAKAEEYQPLARKIASWLNMDYFDETAFRVTQLMYWPSRSSDGLEISEHNKGTFIDPDAVLAEYVDWTDFGTWPTTLREGKLNDSNKKQEDPYDKQGIIGAFCRTFDIQQSIATFELPYQSTDWENRYLPDGSSGASGAVVYASDQCEAAFLYSHHSSDAAGSQLVNSWDLVRLNKFGELDKGYEGAIGHSPSQKAMTAFAMELDEVSKILAGEEFSSNSESEENEEKIPPVRLTYDTLSNEISDYGILDRDIRKTMINRVAAAKLDAADTDVLAALIRKASDMPQPSKQSVLEQIRISSKRLTAELGDESGAIADIEMELLEKTLNEHYDNGNHIKRVDKNWWTYKDGLWALDDDEKVRGKMQKTFVHLRTARPEDMMPLVSAVGDTKTSALVGSLWTMFQSHLAEREESIDPLQLLKRIDLPVINCKNGELHFDQHGGAVFKKHNPANFFTIQIGAAYDPEAECPEWDRFVDMIFGGDKDMVRHAEEMGGYIIQMSRWLKAWVLFKGDTDTGKSTFSEVLQTLLGSASISREMSSYGSSKSNFVEAGLQGKLLITDDDYKKGAILPDGFIKRVSEQKAITGEIKYGGDIQFICRSLPLVLSNYWPVSKDLTTAFRERTQVFHFTRRIKHKSDKRKALMLQNEMSGILNRFIAGISRLRARENWDVPEACQDAHQKWVSHTNPVGMFIEEMFTKTPDGRVKSIDCWHAYLNWYKSSNPSGRPSSKAEFYERLESMLGHRVQGCFKGVALREFDS